MTSSKTVNRPKKVKQSEVFSYTLDEITLLIEKGVVPQRLGRSWVSSLSKRIETMTATKPISSEDEVDENLQEVVDFIRKNKARITKIVGPRKTRLFRQSGHIVDQKLRHNYPKPNQPSLFDLVQSESVRDKLEKYEFEVTAQGVHLTSPEDKLFNAILKLLHECSTNADPNDPKYYMGNSDPGVVFYGGAKKESPVLKIRPAELYKAYLDSHQYSGMDMKFIKNTLMSLSNKKFLMIFDRKRISIKNNKKEVLTDRIEEFQSILRVIKYSEGLGEKEISRLEKGEGLDQDGKSELVIGLNPIVVDQISSKYVEYPTDINRRMIIAAGGYRFVTEAMNVLRDYMLRALSAGNTRVEINEDKLPYILKLDNYIKTHRKKRVAERVRGAIQAVKNLGLISNVEITQGKSGQSKYLFTLNESFNRN